MRTLNRITNIDHILFYKCTRSHSQSHRYKAVKLISKTGDGYFQILLPIIFLIINNQFSLAFVEVIALINLYERIVYFTLKNTCRRKRPPEKLLNYTSIIDASDRFSFPSGHTSSAFLLATTCVVLFGPSCIWLYLWATAVGMSRVFLGVHFPSDIFAGAILGSSIAYLLPQMI